MPARQRLARLPLSFFRRGAAEVAPDLLGRYLVRRLDGTRLVARIVETEAYLGAPDPASHARGGLRSARNESLYLPGGHLYVYLIYGLHHCANAVTGEAGGADAVLLRAAEPVAGEEVMAARRGLSRPRPGDLLGGPGKLCQALGIDRSLDGVRLDRGALTVAAGKPVAAAEIAVGTRIGVDYAGEAAAWPLRFAVAGCRHVSRPHPW
ncbi:MAG: DNA-3-methyladenine glycosylase [Thermoanaerobaculia bacterium]|nr:DNA-3-methyladenine glycosylase [Thermoanaerobaculia bacterium]